MATITRRRKLAWACLVAAVLAAPAVGLAGVAVWQEFAPGSLRQVILTAAALTEPKRVDRMLEGIGVVPSEKPAAPG